MDQESINRKEYTDLNRLVIGFLSIIVPLSSSLAGCVTYQFMNYTNTKSFLMIQVATYQPRSLTRNNNHNNNNNNNHNNNNNIIRNSQQEKRKSRTAEILEIRNQIMNEKLEENNIKENLNRRLDSDNNNNNYNPATFNYHRHPSSFNYQSDSFLKNPNNNKFQILPHNNNNNNNPHHHELLVNNNNLNLNLKKIKKTQILYSFYEQLSFFKDKFNLIALINLALNLTSMALEIVVFKSLIHGVLIDAYATKVYGWPQIMLIVVNFLICTGTRVYFARLASTMLRSPRIFLIGSLVLLSFTVVGTIIQTILVDDYLLNYDEIGAIFDHGTGTSTTPRIELNNDSVQDATSLTFFLKSIRIHKLSLDFFQLVWIGSVFFWDLLISSVLLFNFFDIRKRCRFGSVDGKASLAIMLLFETLLFSTIVTCLVLCSCLVLGGTLNIDFQRLSTIQIGFGSILARLNSISIFCSLQHRVNDGMRTAQNHVLNTQKAHRESAMSGVGFRPEGITDLQGGNYNRRQSRIGSQAIRFPDFIQVEALEEEEEEEEEGEEGEGEGEEGESQQMEDEGETYETERISPRVQDYPELNTGCEQLEREEEDSRRTQSLYDAMNLIKTPERARTSSSSLCEILNRNSDSFCATNLEQMPHVGIHSDLIKL